MKKTDIQFQTQQNKDKLCQGTQRSPQEHTVRRNSASNHWEYHRHDTIHGQPKRTRGTQEIPRQQK
jgi:hypothetical protein